MPMVSFTRRLQPLVTSWRSTASSTGIRNGKGPRREQQSENQPPRKQPDMNDDLLTPEALTPNVPAPSSPAQETPAALLQIFTHLAAGMTALAAFPAANTANQEAALKSLRRARGLLKAAGGLIQRLHDASKDP